MVLFKKVLFHGDSRETEALCTLTGHLTEYKVELNSSTKESLEKIRERVDTVVLRSKSREILSEDEEELKILLQELGIPFLFYIFDKKLSKNLKEGGLDKKNIHLAKMDDNMEIFLEKLAAIIE